MFTLILLHINAVQGYNMYVDIYIIYKLCVRINVYV